MTLVDDRGRLFGRINLVDATAVTALAVLVVLGYGTYLLFKPARPHIDSVSIVSISMQEKRVTRGALLTAKLKVKGSGFNPLLRASLGDSPALAFVFENPNSADVLLGPVGPNDHDLILYDGVQEVARAVGAFTLPAAVPRPTGTMVRGVGWFIGLTSEAANSLRVGYRFPEAAPDFEVVALGPIRPGRVRIRFGSSQVDNAIEGLVEREAVLTIRCDMTKSDSPCSQGERMPPGGTISLPGPKAAFQFAVEDVLPAGSGQRARVQLRLSAGPQLATLKVGDRDAFLDERAAVIASIVARTPQFITAVVELGMDETRDGWRYRGQVVRPGATLSIATDRYEAAGQIESVTVLAKAGGPQ